MCLIVLFVLEMINDVIISIMMSLFQLVISLISSSGKNKYKIVLFFKLINDIVIPFCDVINKF